MTIDALGLVLALAFWANQLDHELDSLPRPGGVLSLTLGSGETLRTLDGGSPSTLTE